jgi:hypothetical protein
MSNSYALITGGSSGIGFEIAKNLAERGFNIVLVSRNEKNLQDCCRLLTENYAISADFISSDLANKESPSHIYKTTQERGYNIEILINNAGYGIASPFHVTSLEDEERFIRVLATSVISLTKLFVRDMVEKKAGKIMIVSSVAAFAPPSAIQVLYGPIKTFMNRFSDAMNSSYNHIGITSTALCPGFTVTNFHTASNVQQMMDDVPAFMKFSSEQIAKEGVEAMFKGKPLCVPTKTYKFLVFLLRATPNWFIRLLENTLAPGRYEKKI